MNDPNHPLEILATNTPYKNRPYTGGEVMLQKSFLYGDFEAELLAPCTSGAVVGFFLYSYNPWYEIDIEILGKYTHTIQTSYVFNGGMAHEAISNHPYKNKLVDTQAPACGKWSKYKIEWRPNYLKFYLDNTLIDARKAPNDSIPNHPMGLHLNLWLYDNENWAGPLDLSQLPAILKVRSISYVPYSF